MAKDWTRAPDAKQRFARYCAPTVLAALLDVTNEEAADFLLQTPGACMPNMEGAVRTAAWRNILGSFGAKIIHPQRSRHEYWDRRMNKGMSETASRYYTVTQYLKLNPTGRIVLGVDGHTLLAKDGEVIADAKYTKSPRSRVMWAAHFDDEPQRENAR